MKMLFCYLIRVGKQVEEEMERKKAEGLESNGKVVKVSMETLQASDSTYKLTSDKEERNQSFALFTQQVSQQFTICTDLWMHL